MPPGQSQFIYILSKFDAQTRQAWGTCAEHKYDQIANTR